ncbi:hypothetical protein C8A01DRAFT_40349 [Parachaetomium inaequale]|uniref:Uncharacterized protein n=1 Tax=Parachaetomium inaequale TaxID=2588326 RepID=A0AAN6P7L7_9PEZI|nr:hypothetical protein C8A01DRAFT_40349 [Parachaetomium inaequale]
MVFEVGGRLLKTHSDTGYPRAFNQAFTAFPRDVGFNNSLSAPQPNFVEGLEIREYQPFPVDEQVSGAVLFRDDPFSVTLPHIAGEWKGRGKDMDEAKMQSAHAEVATFTADGTNINFFAHCAATSEAGVLEYHQYPITSTNLTNSFEDFKKGRKQLRNLQDDARDLSYALRDRLKGHWATHRGPMPSTDQTDGCLRDVPEEAELDPVEQEGDAALPLSAMVAQEELADIGHDVVVDEFIYVPSPPGSSKQDRQQQSSQRRRTAPPKPVRRPRTLRKQAQQRNASLRREEP